MCVQCAILLSCVLTIVASSLHGSEYPGPDRNDVMLLCCAAGFGNLDSVKFYVEEKKVSVNSKDEQGRTPLVRAASSAKHDTDAVVQYLLEQKASLDITNFSTDTDYLKGPLAHAVETGKKEVCTMLLNAHAQPMEPGRHGAPILELVKAEWKLLQEVNRKNYGIMQKQEDNKRALCELLESYVPKKGSFESE